MASVTKAEAKHNSGAGSSVLLSNSVIRMSSSMMLVSSRVFS